MGDFNKELREANAEINKRNGVIESVVDEKKDDIEEPKKEKGLVRKVKLSDGREITFDFGKLRKKSATLVEELDDFYYMLVAEYVSAHSYETFLKLSYKDFAKVRDEVRDFLQED